MTEIRDLIEELVDRLDWDGLRSETVRVRVLTDHGWEYMDVEGPVAELLIQIREWLEDEQ